MEITGCDSVIFTFTRPQEVFTRVLASVLSRWPTALVEDLNAPETAVQPIVAIPIDRLPDGEGYLLFYRDAAMVEHMKEKAYTPMADGDGPFAVITRERREVMFTIAGLDEVWADNHTPEGIQPPEPYPAWLCSPLVIEVTVVSPDDPETHPFSSWALNEVKRACSPNAKHGAVRLPRRPTAGLDATGIEILSRGVGEENAG